MACDGSEPVADLTTVFLRAHADRLSVSARWLRSAYCAHEGRTPRALRESSARTGCHPQILKVHVVG